MNVSAAHNETDGISLKYSTNRTIMNVSTALNKHDGISLYHSTDTSMTHVSAAFNDYDGIHSHNSTDTYILKLVHNDKKNTYIANTASLITLSDSTDCSFTRNKISSIKTISSNVTMTGKVLFRSNTASLGTALISAKNSLLIITDYSNIQFQNNRAINYGGVFYIDTEESYERSASLQDIIQYRVQSVVGGSLITSRTACFVHVEGSRSVDHMPSSSSSTTQQGGEEMYCMKN